MKKLVYIMAAFAIVSVVGVSAMLVYLINKSVATANKSKTEAARAARWAVTKEGNLKEFEQNEKSNEIKDEGSV